MQEAGLDSLIATARAAAAASAQHVVQQALPRHCLADPPCSAHKPFSEQMTDTSDMEVREAPTQPRTDRLDHDGVTQPMCTDVPAPMLHVRSADVLMPATVNSQACAMQPIIGITPEHMLYWVSQAEVAQQLRSSSARAADSSEAQSPAAPAQQKSEARNPDGAVQPDPAQTGAVVASECELTAQPVLSKQKRRARAAGSVDKLAHKPKPRARKRQ